MLRQDILSCWWEQTISARSRLLTIVHASWTINAIGHKPSGRKPSKCCNRQSSRCGLLCWSWLTDRISLSRCASTLVMSCLAVAEFTRIACMLNIASTMPCSPLEYGWPKNLNRAWASPLVQSSLHWVHDGRRLLGSWYAAWWKCRQYVIHFEAFQALLYDIGTAGKGNRRPCVRNIRADNNMNSTTATKEIENNGNWRQLHR